MNISQFLKSLGLEHLRDIFEREQVRSPNSIWRSEHGFQSYANIIASFTWLPSCFRIPALSFQPFSLQWSAVSLLCLIGLSVMRGGPKVLGSELITPSLVGHSFAHRWREQAPAEPSEREAAMIVQLTSCSFFSFCFLLHESSCSEVIRWRLLSHQLIRCNLNNSP